MARQPLPPIAVVNRQRRLPIDRAAVRSLARAVLAAEDASDRGGLEITFVDDAAMAELHQRFLAVAGPTDVITFPSAGDLVEPGAGMGPEETGAMLGEIVVSTDTAIRQAPAYLGDPVLEAYQYVVHGILHLLGYDDHEPAAARRMARRQRALLDAWCAARAARRPAKER